MDFLKSCFSSKVRLAGHYNDHGSTVWRVCWNVTGTILATSGDDGQVRLWKANYMDDWKCVAVLRGDGHGGQSIPMTPSIFLEPNTFTTAQICGTMILLRI